MSKDTLIINLYAGPGAGKSTNAARLFTYLKDEGVDCEYVTEFAKELTWEQRWKTFENQLFIFANQQHRLRMLEGQVDVIVTDSPILLNLVYNEQETTELFKKLVQQEYSRSNNLDVFVNREKPYNPNGRKQTKEQALALDDKIINMLRYAVPYHNIMPGSKRGCHSLMAELKDLEVF
jgi:hypothetical protein